MTTLLKIGAYPKTFLLRNGTKVEIRPLNKDDKARLLEFFQRVPEEDRFYLKENVTAPEVIRGWTSNIDYERVIPIVATVEDEIVADATLHRSRAPARRQVGEIRIVVDPEYRKLGLGSRLIRELLDIGVELGLLKIIFQLVNLREQAAINAAEGMGFKQVAILNESVVDYWGNYQDQVILELPIKDMDLWWRFETTPREYHSEGGY